MKMDRRNALRNMLALATALTFPRFLFAARPDAAFAATSAESVIADLLGATPVDSSEVHMKIPDIAENGAVVPVTVSTEMENVESISIVVDNNPTPLAASFDMTPSMLATVSVRIKMGQSSAVRAIVKADGNVYSTTKEVKVTIGGCGG